MAIMLDHPWQYTSTTVLCDTSSDKRSLLAINRVSFSSPESFASLSVVPPSNCVPSEGTECQHQLPRKYQLGRESLSGKRGMTKGRVAKNRIATYIARFVQEVGGCKRKTGKVHQ